MPFTDAPEDSRPDDYIVETIADVAKAVGLSIATLRREIKKPDGPVVTRLSTRRLGITRRHRREWLARRHKPIATVGISAVEHRDTGVE